MLARMRTLLWLCLAISNMPLQAAECSHTENNFYCVEYLRNYDGDTITFNIPNLHPLLGNNISVRVKNVDAPEMRSTDACEKRLAVIARTYVSQTLLRASRIELMNVERDKYFRVLANVRVNGRYLERTLLNVGLAVPYDGGTKLNTDWCAMLEAYEAG